MSQESDSNVLEDDDARDSLGRYDAVLFVIEGN